MATATSRTPYGSRPGPKSLAGREPQRSGSLAARTDHPAACRGGPGSLAELPERVSPQSAISRFHGAVSRLSEPFLGHLLNLREGRREAVIALDGRGIVGVARFARDAEAADTAEVAVLVAGEWQHRGVTHQMLRPLIARAVSAGITRLRADIMAENTAPRRLFAEVGPTLRESVVNGHVVVTIDLPTTVERP